MKVLSTLPEAWATASEVLPNGAGEGQNPMRDTRRADRRHNTKFIMILQTDMTNRYDAGWICQSAVAYGNERGGVRSMMPLQKETIRSVLVCSEIRQDLPMPIIDPSFRREGPEIRVFGVA